MGLLAPLYMAGLAALSLPLVLHLIRRTPRGRQAFSSLMFLTPSPPRLTRRSRLDHVLLLLLRLAALAILAFAFARPFLREAAMLPLDNLGSRRVAILLDTSASMRRADLWQQAVAKVAEVLRDLAPKDDVALFTFDDGWQPVVDFAQDASEPTTGKPELVRQRLKNVAPSWRSTDLAKALAGVAGELQAANDQRRLALQPQLVLITDLARGSRLDALEAHKWPDEVPVVVHALAAKRPTNAAIRLLADDESAAADEPRVRVANAANSTGEEFFVCWRRPADKAVGNEGGGALSTYVPAGQSRVIRLPRPAGEAAADRIVLKGDEAEFDNTYYVVPLVAQQVKIDWIGDESADDAESPRYYFELALADDPARKVDVSPSKAEQPWDASMRPNLVVLTSAIPVESRDALRDYVNKGGTILALLKDASILTSLSTFFGDVVLTEGGAAKGGDGANNTSSNKRLYSLLGEIDFTHPLFASFANPRYSDFTKIHFWRHRAVTVDEASATRIVARFDNGDPAILESEREAGAGRVIAFTSGWQPDESQLALSSKFVPLIHAILDLACGGPTRTANLTVGQPVPLPVRPTSQAAAIEKPDGTRVAIAADARSFEGADQPGIFRLHMGEDEYPFAVNLDPGESNTAPMEPERLEQLGVRFASQLTRGERAEKLRQQRDTELESRQQLWRWLLVGALGVLILETWLAGRAARRIASVAAAAAIFVLAFDAARLPGGDSRWLSTTNAPSTDGCLAE